MVRRTYDDGADVIFEHLSHICDDSTKQCAPARVRVCESVSVGKWSSPYVCDMLIADISSGQGDMTEMAIFLFSLTAGQLSSDIVSQENLDMMELYG